MPSRLIDDYDIFIAIATLKTDEDYREENEGKYSDQDWYFQSNYRSTKRNLNIYGSKGLYS